MGLRPFVVNRNICNFLWYGGVEGGAGEGLRSDGVEDLPLSKSGCSILPIARRLSGRGFRAAAFILPLAALYTEPLGARPLALPPCVARDFGW
jgi:hypothetical protein